MSSSTNAAVNGNGGMSEIGRITGVFWSPGAAFQDIAQRPRPWVPIILGMIVGVIMMASFGNLVGWETFLEQELANNSRVQELPIEQQQRIETRYGVSLLAIAYTAPPTRGLSLSLLQ